MPTSTTASSIVGASGVPELADIRPFSFTTTDNSAQNYDFTITDPPLGPAASAFIMRVEASAVGSGSESAFVGYAAYYDNGTAISLIGSSTPLTAGAASMTFATTGTRTARIIFNGLNGQTLTWRVNFFISRQ